MLFSLGPYELVIIAAAFAAVTLVPMAASVVVAWVRRRRAKRQG